MTMKYVAAILGLVIVIGGGYLLLGSTPSGENGSDLSQGGEYENGEEAFSGSLQALSARGGNYKCTIKHDSAVALSSGVVYIAGDRLRGDFVSEAEGITVESHMIAKDGYTYTWTPIAPTGFRARVAAGENDSSNTGTSGSYADIQQSYQYQCEAWSVDEAQFTIPQITFIDVN